MLFGSPALLIYWRVLAEFFRRNAIPCFFWVTLDAYMKFDEHISLLVSKCMAKLCQIGRIRHLLDQKTLCSVVQALVLTRLFYCSSVWANTTAKNVKKLQLVQARVISNTRRFDHITPSYLNRIEMDDGWPNTCIQRHCTNIQVHERSFTAVPEREILPARYHPQLFYQVQ
jgi:hypothetical protein